DEVKALKPQGDACKASPQQSLPVGFKRLRHQHVLQGAPLLGNLQVTIAPGTLETVVQVGQQRLLGGIVEGDFLRQYQGATGEHAAADAGEQRFACFHRQKLQGEVEHHQ